VAAVGEYTVQVVPNTAGIVMSGLTFGNSTFCSHSVFMGFVWI